MNKTIFEQIKKINEYGAEYWSARDLMLALGYDDWRNFEKAIDRSVESCKGSKQAACDHFIGAGKMIEIAAGTQKAAMRDVSWTLCRKKF